MRFNKGWCQILHLGWSTPGYTFKLENERLESSPMKRDVGVWVDGKLKMSQQCASTTKKADSVLDASNTALWASQRRWLFCSALCWCRLTWSSFGPLTSVHFWPPQYKKGNRLLECVRRKVTKMMKSHRIIEWSLQNSFEETSRLIQSQPPCHCHGQL